MAVFQQFPADLRHGRLAGGASLWSDFIYDDYGATQPRGPADLDLRGSSGLAPRQGTYALPRRRGRQQRRRHLPRRRRPEGRLQLLARGLDDARRPDVPIAEWTFDTDNNAATGASAWPAAGRRELAPGSSRRWSSPAAARGWSTPSPACAPT